MEAPRKPTKPPGVAATGWLCVVAGALTFIGGGLFALAGAMAQALAQEGTDVFAQADAPLDPLTRGLLDHYGLVSGVLVLLGVVSLIVGVQFLRMRPAARIALEVLAWAVLAATVFLEIAALAAPQGEASAQVPGWVSSPITSLLLSALQAIACFLVIRFVRSPAVREAFRTELPSTRG